MMAALFLFWAVTFALAGQGRRKPALVVGLISLALCLAMFRYHTTDAIRLSL
jgi:hypothetical protein